MGKKVIIHIGFGKTGTSSVQEMLHSNARVLKKLGILYPETGIFSGAHHRLAEYKAHDMSELIKGLYAAIVNEFNDSGCDVLLLSSEQFCFCKPGYVKAMAPFFEGFDVEILFYVRRQQELIASTFMQKVKGAKKDRHSDDIDTFLKTSVNAFDFNLRLQAWVSEFGEESIKVRPYRAGEEGYDACGDFLDAIGVEEELPGNSGLRENPSLLPEFVDLVKIIDSHSDSDDFREEVMKSLLALSVKFKSKSKASVLNEEHIERISLRYEEPNRKFAERYMSDSDKPYLLS